jgi:formyltetrahydrofolate-dependent phosphoribosylglycinamide formyltransferase
MGERQADSAAGTRKDEPAPPLRLGVLLSGGGRTLQNLIDCIVGGSLHASIQCVISSKIDAYGLTRATGAGIASHTVPRREIRDPEFHDRITGILTAADVEVVCMAGFTCLWRIPPEFNQRVINIHPALLPDFGGQGFYGSRVHRSVLDAGVDVSGCTVHFCDNEYDHGSIVLQRECPVLPGDTVETLAARVFELECAAYPEAIRQLVPRIPPRIPGRSNARPAS